MTTVEFLGEELRKAYSDHPWHGASLADLLRDLTAEEAAVRPVSHAHSVWEIVLHMAAWNGEVRRRLEGSVPAMPSEGDWPGVGEPSEAAWQRARERLAASVASLRETLAGMTEEQLDRRGGSLQDAELGTGGTLRGMVNGVVQHLAYHGGQIGLLRKALRPGP
ncbi:MAG TPA: DinB family protein [Thermoanaerobaculia bacterium]